MLGDEDRLNVDETGHMENARDSKHGTFEPSSTQFLTSLVGGSDILIEVL